MIKLVVSIVNYKDPEFFYTVKNLWDNAYYKENIYFSIVSEDDEIQDFSFIPQRNIRYLHFEAKEYRGGLCWARNLATKLNFEYEYFIQFDSHTASSKHWDKMIIDKYEELSKKYTKFIISHAPPNYEINEDGTINKKAYPQRSRIADKSDIIPAFQFPSYKILEKDSYEEGYWVTCCHLFSKKDWVDEVGFDEVSSFNTEEINLSIRTFAKGWKVLGVDIKNVFHHESHRQANGQITRENKRPWADERADKYWEHVEHATNKCSELMSGKLDVTKEKVSLFFEKSGINKKYLDHIPDYYNHIIINNRCFGMPPRPQV